MSGPMRVGLTGGIASGKSTVAERFAELGVPVVDADVAARRVVQPGAPGLDRVARRFGKSVLKADGSLDRAALRAIAFVDSAARKDLEAILHPLIRDQMDSEIAVTDYPYVLLAIPLLVETGSPKSRVDRVLVVDVPEKIQIERLIGRDGSSHAEARAILDAQATRGARLAIADDVLDNSGPVDGVRQAVEELHRKYLQIGLLQRQRPN